MITFAPGEKVELVVRRHWLVFVAGLIPFFITGVLVLLLKEMLLVGEVLTPLGTIPISTFPPEYIHIGANLVLLFMWLGVMHFVTDYYLDTWIITNERIIGILQRGFFSRQITNFRIERIQDVQTNTHGFFQTIFGIGDLHVQTAGHAHDLIMHTIGNTKDVKQKIMDMIKARPLHLHDV